MAYARTRVCTIGMQTARKTTGTDSASSLIYVWAQATVPAIGDKPIELLTNMEWCNFGRGLIIFGRGLKLHARFARA